MTMVRNKEVKCKVYTDSLMGSHNPSHTHKRERKAFTRVHSDLSRLKENSHQKSEHTFNKQLMFYYFRSPYSCKALVISSCVCILTFRLTGERFFSEICFLGPASSKTVSADYKRSKRSTRFLPLIERVTRTDRWCSHVSGRRHNGGFVLSESCPRLPDDQP